MLHDWTRGDFPYRDILELNFFTPYLPAYLLGTTLAFIVPAVTAAKILWSLGAIGTVYATTRIRARLGGDPLWDWLILPGLFGMTFVWGLLTFQVTVPLGLLGLEYWIVYLRAPTTRRAAAFGSALVALFFCHSLVTAWLMSVAGLMHLLHKPTWSGTRKRAILVGLPLLAPLPVVALWLAFVRQVSQLHAPIVWGSLEERTVLFFTQWLGTGGGVAATALFGGTLLLSPFVAGARIHPDAVRRAPLVVTVGIIMLVPDFLMGNAFTYNRFFTLLGPSFVIALASAHERSARELRMRILMPGIAIGWLLLVSIQMVAFDREQRGFFRVLNAMQPDAHALAFMQDASSLAMQNSQTYLHFGAWYQAEKGGLAQFSFAAFLPTIVHFRPTYRGVVPESFAVRPSLDFVERHGREFDYVLVRTTVGGQQPLRGSPFREVAHDGQWWLFTTDRSR